MCKTGINEWCCKKVRLNGTYIEDPSGGQFPKTAICRINKFYWSNG